MLGDASGHGLPAALEARDVVVGLQHVAERGGRDGTVVTNRQPGDLGAFVFGEPLHRVEDGMVLNGGGNNAPPALFGIAAGPVDALDGEVVALGATCGEDHLRRARAEQVGQRLARLLHPAARTAARAVQ